MAGPFIFISQSRVKDGKLEDFKRGLREMAEFAHRQPRELRERLDERREQHA